jgi:selenide,water dikinase
MARASGVRLAFDAAALPALPGALELARAGVETGGAAHNRRFVAGDLEVSGAVSAEIVTLAHDPQTSGGLLAAIPEVDVVRVSGQLHAAAVDHWLIGRVETGSGIAVI